MAELPNIKVGDRVRAYYSDRFWSGVNIRGPDDCWEWTRSRTQKGYGHFYCDGRQTLAHRIANFLSTGIQPGPFDVMHSCDNPPCCNPSHLEAGTRKQNMQDAFRKGRTKVGQAVKNAKLTDADVVAIRHDLANGRTVRSIAKQYGVERTSISHIKTGKNWAHITSAEG